MVTATDDWDDDSFAWYVPSTVDPGYTLLIILCIFCFLSNAILPCLVSMGRRYEKRKLRLNPSGRESEVTATTEKSKVEQLENGVVECKLAAVANETEGGEQLKTKARCTPLDSAYTAAVYSKTLFDQLIMPPYADEGSVVGGSATVGMRTNHPSGAPPVREAASEMTGSEVCRSVLTSFTGKSGSTGFGSGTHFLDVGRGGGRSHRRQRRVLMDKTLRRKDQRNELEADRREYVSLLTNDVDGGPEHASELKSGHYEAKAVQSEVASRVSHPSNRVARATRGRKRGEGSAISDFDPSLLPPLDENMISPNDAADANDPGTYNLPKAEMAGDKDIDFCSGKYAWWRPAMIGAGFDRLINIAERDHEMKRIMKLCIPFSIARIIELTAESIEMALVAHFLGTDSLVAYALVDALLSLTFEFLSGILAAESTLCSHAYGARNFKLAGQYVQISIIIYILLYIPIMILWIYFIEDIILLFGFDQNIADIAQTFAMVRLFEDLFLGIIEAYDGLLEVIGFEIFTTALGAVFEIIGISATAVLLVFRKETTLTEVALLNMCGTFLYLLMDVSISVYGTGGRLNKYVVGICTNPASVDRATLWHVMATSLPLMFGYLFENSEWEMLTIFAAYLGTAEVAAWGILGNLWSCLEGITEAVSDAGEIRVGYHLGGANPGMAQISTYKVTLIAVCLSSFVTAILFIMGENLAIWFTPDPALQNMVAELIPLLGVGNLTLTAGGVAWAMLGAQARYRLATLVALIASWCVTLPLAAILTYGFRINLKGIVFSVIFGNSISCTVLFYILLRSDWERISHHIVLMNAEDEESDDSDDDSSVEDAENP